MAMVEHSDSKPDDICRTCLSELCGSKVSLLQSAGDMCLFEHVTSGATVHCSSAAVACDQSHSSQCCKRTFSISETIDTEQFIIEIQLRSTLWDSRTDDYSNKIMKKKGWVEICKLITTLHMIRKCKRLIANETTNLQKKWKNIKDCYSRETKNKKREIVDQLPSQEENLSPLFNTKRSRDQGNVDNSVASPSTPIPSSTLPSAAPVPPPPYHTTPTSKAKKQKKPQDDDATVMSLIAEKIKTLNSQPKYDPDMHFVLSLYDDFHKIPQ
ncbi:unnamed protein product [Leptidea sinapis]|uniref:MADF domain-containing protein n=1 Tax=Leptidea sinapis TaxID=189913 RepID=A0A5E4QLT6_9NEOP|nr:unnamed protein product [Leptidea sinapis]